MNEHERDDRIVRVIREKIEHDGELKTGAVLSLVENHPAWVTIEIQVRPGVEPTWNALFRKLDQSGGDPGPQHEDDPVFLGEDPGEVRVRGENWELED